MNELIIEKDQLKDIHFEGINGQQAIDFNELVQINRSKEIVLTLSTPTPMDKLVEWLEWEKEYMRAGIERHKGKESESIELSAVLSLHDYIDRVLAKAKELK